MQQAPGSSHHRVADVSIGGYRRVGVRPYQTAPKEGVRVGSRRRGSINEKILTMDLLSVRSWKWTLLSLLRGGKETLMGIPSS